MKRAVRFTPGFDCIQFECIHDSKSCAPGKGGSHGKHGVNIRWTVTGEKGAVQFVLFAGWLPHKATDYAVDPPGSSALPADLGYHSPTPRYDDQTERDCDLLPGGTCFYDGSGLNASLPFQTLCNRGEDALWEFLEQYYRCVFEDGDFPKPANYPKPRRDSKPAA